MKKILVIGAHPDDCDIYAGGCAALWSDRGDVQAQGSLRQTLTVLRNALEPGGSSPLVVETGEISIAMESTAAMVTAIGAFIGVGLVAALVTRSFDEYREETAKHERE